MKQIRAGMTSPRWLHLFAGFCIISACHAGPLGPLPEFTNVTSSDLGHKEGSCAVGDVVYMSGDGFPGAGPCERCECARGEVRCARARCEPRPGCKALHRPDQCCPTYQCECEQEGRVYGNGEKLVDPADPCRVCYCQGGEVVCRRIACFLRDDCEPRLVPGRCCPEYDNCPLRGVTVPGASTTPPSISLNNADESNSSPMVPKEVINQKITIKEITPVSEIPVITDVKIKEILPSPSIDVAEYSSSKSPLIPREATSEKNASPEITERPTIIEIHSPSLSPEITASSSEISETKTTFDLAPSKISLSTQDSINSDIYPSQGTLGISTVFQDIIPVATTIKPAIILEEEDTISFDHNPAFPPIPDDLSVVGTHEDENIPDTNIEVDNVQINRNLDSTTTTSTEASNESHSTTASKDASEATGTSPSTSEIITQSEVTETKSITSKQSPMLNLRSAIPTEILNVPSVLPEDITGELDDVTETTTGTPITSPVTSTTSPITTNNIILKTTTGDKVTTVPSIPGIRIIEVTSPENIEAFNTNIAEELPSTSMDKSSTEITAQTEFSSIPIETSDQNPPEETKEKLSTSSVEPTVVETVPIEPEVITVSSDIPFNTENQSFENVETTEFVLTSFGSSETATSAVELIKVVPETNKNAAIIEPAAKNRNNVLTDLINLVGDVASISDHSETPNPNQPSNATSISESEELIPVNAGYKSKNSNFNLNSITETIPKSKNPVPANKQKVIEIEDDESEGLTDSPPPHDKVEPTTRRPIIDNVSDDKPENKTEKKDIEIITPTFVPTVNQKPTKVVMKKNNDKPISDEVDGGSISISSEGTTDSSLSASSEVTATPKNEVTSSEKLDRKNGDAPSTAPPSSTSQ